MSAELLFHLESQISDYMKQGLGRKDAESRARREFGPLDLSKDECRDQRPLESFDHFLRDVRYAYRSLRKSPGFTAAAVVTLAIGIGANTAIFSVVERAVLASLPYREPDRLVVVWLNNPTLKHFTMLSYPDFLDWERNASSFQQMAAVHWQDHDLSAPGASEHLHGQEVSSAFFSALGVRLALGRDFTPEEDRRGGPPAAIISNGLWRDRFAGDATVLGKPVTLDGVDYTIVGVLQPGFRFWTESDVYTPIGQGNPTILQDRLAHAIVCIARLKPDVSLSRAQAEMSTIQAHLDQVYPAAEQGLGTGIMPLQQQLVGDLRGTLLLLMAAVGLVLLIACANVANLLLSRSAARSRELAIRAALGASRSRIVQQLVTESVLLSLTGGTFGFLVAVWGGRLVVAAVPGTLPLADGSGLNFPTLFFTAGVSILVGILFGLAPALKSSRTNLEAGLKDGSRGSTAGHYRVQSMLVIFQMAVTLVLLAGAGLLFRTIQHLWEVNPGFDAQHVITFKVGLSSSVTRTASSTRIAYQQLIERIRHIPGVEGADVTTLVPLSNKDNSAPFWLGSQKPASMAQAPRVLLSWTGPDYLRTMGLRLIRGRFVSQADTIDSIPVAVIDQVLAQTYFGNRDPVGQTLSFAQQGPYRIVGVVAHVQHWGLGNESRFTRNQAYCAFYQIADQWMSDARTQTTVLVRSPLDLAMVMPAIKQVIFGVGSDQPVYDVQAMGDIVSASMASQRFPLTLLATFAGLALLLASVGIYGVISYLMTQRAHEIGIRMALGAGRGDVLRMIVLRGLRLAVAGVAIGAVVASMLAPLLSSFSHLLYGVRTTDPLTFLFVSLVLMSAALLACYIPARRAATVDPMAALRHE